MARCLRARATKIAARKQELRYPSDRPNVSVRSFISAKQPSFYVPRAVNGSCLKLGICMMLRFATCELPECTTTLRRDVTRGS